MSIEPMGSNELTEIEQIEIDFLILADWAETINGKLYIQGAGWDRKLKKQGNEPFELSVAAGILVPWNETNRENSFQMILESDDGEEVGLLVEGTFTVGRPASAQQGQKLRTPFSAKIGLAKPLEVGVHIIKFVVNNSITKSVTFYVVDKL